jgi:hypothetical protein
MNTLESIWRKLHAAEGMQRFILEGCMFGLVVHSIWRCKDTRLRHPCVYEPSSAVRVQRWQSAEQSIWDGRV